MIVDTRGRFSFTGGVHPPEMKDLTGDCAIQPGPDIKEAAVMLSQHIGALCQLMVRKGDMVQAGQKSLNRYVMQSVRPVLSVWEARDSRQE
nr:electron transport complex subunit RsxC [uncultured archaeon]